jgi:DNA ligase 1
MNLDTIYKKDVTGKIRIWWAEVGELTQSGYWRTHSGTINGEIITSEWKWCDPKSQPTPRMQAEFNARSEMDKKLRIDYKENIFDVDGTRFSSIRPMLANDYVGWVGPCFSQPKLDGMRCLANKEGLWTRTNKQIISVPHIEGVLKAFFQTFPNIILDGELYNHILYDNFNLIMSLARKTKPSFEDLERSKELLQYWIYDMYDIDEPNDNFRERWQFLQDQVFNIYEAPIMHVPTVWNKTKEELDVNYIKLLEDGYEGQIVRLNAAYEEKRSSKLLKRKEFVDKEFELLDIQEGQGNWEGLAKIAICALPDGRQFGAGISGTQAYAHQLLADRKKYSTVTVKYHALTPDGIPRFPIAVKFYEKEWDALEANISTKKKDLFS